MLKCKALCALLIALLFCGCAVAPSAPADSVPAETADAAVSVSPACTETPKPTSTPTPAPTATPEPTPFSLAWISDTQNLNGERFAAVTSMYDWITRIRDEENVIALAHTGDIVQNVYDEAHWQLNLDAARALPDDLLRITACGNHDYSPDKLGYQNYLTYRFDSPIPPENSCLDGLCFYQTLHVGDMDLLFLSIAYFMENESIEWARSVLDAHPDHFCILLAHSYLMPNPDHPEDCYGSGGTVLRENLVIPCPNVRMVLCGHNRGVTNKETLYDDDGDGTPDRTVYELMMNYQATGKEDMGFMRLIRFDPAADTITLVTYSPYLDDIDYYLPSRRPDVVFSDAHLS